MKKPGQYLAGFALETENEGSNATEKLNKKNLDLIVLNSLNDTGAGFGTSTNKVSIIFKEGNIVEFDLKPKSQVATDIWDTILSHSKSLSNSKA
jgi:phosphopantothenoylcysteine decarboxylase/phosphopantothenate--cysteine ligase